MANNDFPRNYDLFNDNGARMMMMPPSHMNNFRMYSSNNRNNDNENVQDYLNDNQLSAVYPAFSNTSPYYPYPFQPEQFQQQQENIGPRSFQQELMARRYSSPQMGYYDLITGEYRYRSTNDNYNQMSSLSNYAGETEPPMCENTCQWCQIRLPFNCLTISLITSLMLLIMFSLFQAILTTNSKNPINTSLFNDMIFLTSLLTIVFFLLTIIRYICIDRFHVCNHGFCRKCKIFTTIIGDIFSTNSSKHISYGPNHQGIDEEFV